MRLHRPFLILALLSMPASLPAQIVQQINVNVGTSDRNGVCAIEYPFDDNKRLEISVRADNGNVNVAVHNLDGDYVDDALERDPDFNITLTFDNGTSVTSDFAAYRAGMTYRAMGAWQSNEGGHPVLSALKTAESMEVAFEQERYGPISAQMPSFGYHWLKNCVEGNGGVMPV